MTRNEKNGAWVVAGALFLWWLLSRRPSPAGTVTLTIDDPNYPDINGKVLNWPPDQGSGPGGVVIYN